MRDGPVRRRRKAQGAAGVELSADWVIAELLESPELSGLAEAYVLDELGQIVLQSSEDREFSDLLLQRRRIRLKRFDVPQVVTAVRDGVNGHVLLPDGDLVVYYRMDSMGWYYVIRGPGRPLLRGAGPG